MNQDEGTVAQLVDRLDFLCAPAYLLILKACRLLRQIGYFKIPQCVVGTFLNLEGIAGTVGRIQCAGN